MKFLHNPRGRPCQRMSQYLCLNLPSNKSKQRHENLEMSGIYTLCLSLQTLYQNSVVPVIRRSYLALEDLGNGRGVACEPSNHVQCSRAEHLRNSRRLISERLRRE